MATGVRQQRGQATRAEILSVARRLFSDFGYHNTGIADIQAATGLTKGAFYHHFRAKQELALAVLEGVRDDYACHLLGPAMDEATPGRRLAALLDGTVNLNERPEWRNCRLLATLCAEVTAADGQLTEAVRAVQDRMVDTMAQLIGEAQESGEAVPGSPGVWAQLLTSTLMGLLLARKIGVTRAEPAEVVEQLKRGLLAADFRAAAQVEAEPKSTAPRVTRVPEDPEYF